MGLSGSLYQSSDATDPTRTVPVHGRFCTSSFGGGEGAHFRTGFGGASPFQGGAGPGLVGIFSEPSVPALPLLPAERSRKKRSSKNRSGHSDGHAEPTGAASAAASPPSPPPIWAIPFWVFPVLLLLVGFGFFLYNSRAEVAYPYALENGEGMSLRWGMMMASGETVYRPLSPKPPFIGCNYPPLYMWVASRFLNPDKPSLLPFRMISILSALALGVCIYGIVQLMGGGHFGGIVGALAFFAVPFINATATWARVDWMAGALTFTGVWLVWPRREERAGVRRTIRITAGLLCMALATFTKQSAIVAPATFSLWILWRRRREWYWILVLAGFGLLIHGIATLATKGQYFLWVGPYSSGRYSFRLLLVANQAYLSRAAFLILLGVVLGLIVFRVRPRGGGGIPSWPSRGERSFYWLYLVLTFVSLASVGRRGSSLHYFIEFTVLLCVLAGALTGRIVALRRVMPRAYAFCALFFTAIFVVHGLRYVSTLTRVDNSMLTFNRANAGRVLRAVRDSKGPILTEDVFYTAYMKKPLYIENPFMYSDLTRRGLIDPKPLIEDISRGRLAFVCLDSHLKKPGYMTRDRFAPPILRALQRAYPYEKQVGDRYLSFRNVESTQKRASR